MNLTDVKFRLRYRVSRTKLRTTLFEMTDDLRATDDPLAKAVANALFMGWYDLDDARFSPLTSLAYIGVAAEDPDWLVRDSQAVSVANVYLRVQWPEAAVQWGLAFVKQFLKEIRAAICEENSDYNKLTKEYKNSAQAFVVAVAPLIASKLGVSDPAASGLAALILLCLVNATQRTFCKMTDEQVCQALDRGASG